MDEQSERERYQAAMQALRAGEVRFRAVFDQAPVGIVQADPKGRYRMINERFCEITGYDRSELIGRSPEDITYPDDVGPDLKAVTKVRSGEASTFVREKRYICKDGRIKWVRVNASAVRDEQGQLESVLAVIEDIHEQKRVRQQTDMEHAVSHILARSRTFEEAIPEVLRNLCAGLEMDLAEVWLPDRAEKTLRCHRSYLPESHPDSERFAEESRRFRFAAGEGLPGRVWVTREPAWIVDIRSGENLPRAGLAATAGLQTATAFPVLASDEFMGAICSYAKRQIQPDKALMETMAAVGNECGQFIRRRRAERVTEASELRKSAILESSLDGIITMGAEGRIVDFNPAAERMFGYRRAEAAGRFLADLIIPERLREQHWQGLKRYLETREGKILGRRIEMPAMRADGSEFPAELTVIATHLNGEPFFTGYLRDVTEARRSREQLEARARQQAAVASFGQKALAGGELQEVFDEAVRLVAKTLDHELCQVLRLLPGGRELQLEAGAGWEKGLAGRWRMSSGQQSQAGYALLCDQPVVTEDLAKETRFTVPSLLREHGVVSGMSVVIQGEERHPWGVLGTHTVRRREYSKDDVNFLQAMANILATAIQRKAAEERLQHLNETLEQRVAERSAAAEQRATQLQAMAVELSRAEERERRRLAEVLHDHLQQMLAASKLQVGMLSKKTTDPKLQPSFDKVMDLLGQAIELSRNLTVELSPPILYEAGLVPALEWLCRWMQEKHALAVRLEVARKMTLDDENLRILVFQSVRELLFNVAKHAEARKAQVTVGTSGGEFLAVTVADSGKGFHIEQLSPEHRKRHGFGLLNIRKRMEMMGGQVEVSSSPGKGTRVTLRIPSHHRRARG